MQTSKRFTDATADTAAESPTKKPKLSHAAAIVHAHTAMDESSVEGRVHGLDNATIGSDANISLHLAAAAPLLLRLVAQPASTLLVNPPRSYSVSGVLHCFDTDTLQFVAERLDQEHITAMPVCTHENVVTDFIDATDLVNFVASAFSQYDNIAAVGDFDRIWKNIDVFNQSSVANCIFWSRMAGARLAAPQHALPAGYSLLACLEQLARTGYERVAVTNAAGQIVTIVTQSMMIDFVHENRALLGDAVLQRQVSAFKGLHEGLPCTIKATDKAIVGFKKMSKLGVSGIAVVDAHGALVDCLSNKDLRGYKLTSTSIWGLYSHVETIKAEIRALYPDAPKNMITVDGSATLGACLELMSSTRVHQVFVVNAAGAPVKMVSQRNVLFQVLE